MANARVLAKWSDEEGHREMEIIQIDGDYFLRTDNVWDTGETNVVTITEARRLALEWGETPDEVASWDDDEAAVTE